jgi:valyl-tRNA synthetase
MMMGIHFMGEVPFEKVFINALVRDDKGQKMSKSKGNVMDPLDLIDEYGADPLRFTMVAMSGQSRDIKLSKQRIEGYRNFGTKLWNAARFCQMHECVAPADFDPAAVKQATNRWIRSETVKTVQAVTAALEACAFDDAANALYRFIWNVFCDWYVELSKPVLNGDDLAAKAETRATAAWTLEVILKLLHPVSPFITEELWDKLADLGRKRDGMLINAAWPDLPAAWIDPVAEEEIGKVINVITEPRTARSELNVPPSARPALYIHDASPQNVALYKANAATIIMMARVSELVFGKDAPPGSVSFVVDGGTMSLPVSAHIDVAAEKARLGKEIAALSNDAERTRKKLDNADFIARAPEEVVAENRERLADAEAAQAKLQAALQRLETVG